MSLYKGDGDKSEPSSFRPISLTSIIIRTFEHMIHRKLISFLNSKSFFHPLQFGFRAQRSTHDAISNILSTIKNVCRTKKADPYSNYCPVVFLDLKKAFDRVWHDYLLDTLRQANITGKAWIWISAFLSNRYIRTVDSDEASNWHPIHYGVPQGSVLSPLLFIIFINPIVMKISTQCPLVQPVLYADDKALKPNKQPNTPLKMIPYLRQLRHSLSLLTLWCNKTGMLFNAKKTKLVVFNGVHQPNYTIFLNLQLCNFTIDKADTYHYLGLTLHYKLSWGDHITKVIHRTQIDSHRLCCVARTSGKAPPPSFATIRALTLGYLQPRWTYGFAFWGHQLSNTDTRKIQSLLISPIRCSLRLPPTTNQLGLYIEAHLASVTALFRHACLSLYQRSLNLPLTHPSTMQLLTDTQFRANTKYPLKPERYAHTYRLIELEIAPHYINTIIPHIIQQYQSINKPVPASLQLSTIHDASDLTKPILKQLIMWDTHYEWMSDTKHTSTAPLLTHHCKPIPLKSLFLFHEDLPLATLRAKLRANRANTQQRLNFINDPDNKPSPLCTHAACNPPPALPSPLVVIPPIPAFDTVPHILLHCHRHAADRTTLIQSLSSLHYAVPLTVAFLTGTTSYSIHPNLSRTKALLAHTATFLTSIVSTRANDPSLSPFMPDLPG